MSLQVDPKLWRSTKVTGEPERSIGGDCAATTHDIIDTRARYLDDLRQGVNTDLHGLQEIITQNFTVRLRQNPLCKEPPNAGENVIVVLSYGTVRSRIISPRLLPQQYRANFNTFIRDVPIAGGSGSGVFHAERKCLLGILTNEIWRYNYQI